MLGCVAHDDGVVVDVTQRHRPAESVWGIPRHFTTDRGYEITLDRGYIVLRTVQLVPCAMQTQRRGGVWHQIRAALAFEGTAYAHEVDVLGYLDRPAAEDLLGRDDVAIPLGRMRALPLEVCGVNVLLGRAIEGTLGAPADGILDGQTLLVAGSWRASNGTAAAFSFTTAMAVPVLRTTDGLVLADTRRHAALSIVHASFDRWFDGIELATADPELVANQLLARAAAALQVEALQVESE